MAKKIAVIILVLLVLAGCSQKQPGPNTSTVVLETVHEAVKKEYGEDYLAEASMDSTDFVEQVGVSKDLIDSMIAETAMMSFNIDRYFSIRTIPGKGAEVETILSEYLKNNIQEGFLYPMNLPKAKAGEVFRHGDDVYLIVLGKNDDRDEATPEERITFARNEVARGRTIIDNFYK